MRFFGRRLQEPTFMGHVDQCTVWDTSRTVSVKRVKTSELYKQICDFSLGNHCCLHSRRKYQSTSVICSVAHKKFSSPQLLSQKSLALFCRCFSVFYLSTEVDCFAEPRGLCVFLQVKNRWWRWKLSPQITNSCTRTRSNNSTLCRVSAASSRRTLLVEPNWNSDRSCTNVPFSTRI